MNNRSALNLVNWRTGNFLLQASKVIMDWVEDRKVTASDILRPYQHGTFARLTNCEFSCSYGNRYV